MKIVEPSAFGARLLEVFEEIGGDNVRSKIADVLGVKLSAVTNYLQDRVPDADKLRLISNSTNCSIHWLITGEGDKYLNSQKKLNLDDTFREVVREIVREEIDSKFPVTDIRYEKKRDVSVK